MSKLQSRSDIYSMIIWDLTYVTFISMRFSNEELTRRKLSQISEAVRRGFILVHLNIHDSLHFSSKRHLFI
uniref:Uncharacterized protein n=1 Tax=Sarcophilus harrisii TaxID=9305 RepID=A0A7N4Q1M0_SARHA